MLKRNYGYKKLCSLNTILSPLLYLVYFKLKSFAENNVLPQTTKSLGDKICRIFRNLGKILHNSFFLIEEKLFLS